MAQCHDKASWAFLPTAQGEKLIWPYSGLRLRPSSNIEQSESESVYRGFLWRKSVKTHRSKKLAEPVQPSRNHPNPAMQSVNGSLLRLVFMSSVCILCIIPETCAFIPAGGGIHQHRIPMVPRTALSATKSMSRKSPVSYSQMPRMKAISNANKKPIANLKLAAAAVFAALALQPSHASAAMLQNNNIPMENTHKDAG
jgi:hypothetical protein